jgi:hypothetical protein
LRVNPQAVIRERVLFFPAAKVPAAGGFFQNGGIVSVASTTLLILTSLPVAFREGPVQDKAFVARAAGIGVDRIMDLSSEVPGRAINPWMLTAGSGAGAEVISADPAGFWTHPAVKRTKPVRASSKTDPITPAGKREYDIG